MRKFLASGVVLGLATLLSGCAFSLLGLDKDSQGEGTDPLIIKKTVTAKQSEEADVTVTVVESATEAETEPESMPGLSSGREYAPPTDLSSPVGHVLSGTITQHSDIAGVDGRSYEVYIVTGRTIDDLENVHYPSLGCAGYLEPLGGGDYIEHITVGDCDNKGTWKISEYHSSTYSRDVEYAAPTGRYTSTGTLVMGTKSV